MISDSVTGPLTAACSSIRRKTSSLLRELRRLQRKVDSSLLLSSLEEDLISGHVLCGGRWRHTDQEVGQHGH